MGNLWLKMFLVFLLMNEAAVNAKEFKVGDDLGWREPNTNDTLLYNHWAATNRFHVGDSLTFEYKKKNDSVLVVEKWDYYHCNTTKPISAFDNGKSTVDLNRPGPYYFISGAPDHCIKGQRLLVDVVSPLSHSHVSPSPAPASSAVSVSVKLPTLLLFALADSLFSIGY